MQSWGLHFICDGFTTDIDSIKSEKHIANFVEQLVEDIEMVAYGDLWIERFATHDEAKAGISFVQMIETSNITGHFCEVNGDFYIDVFSCKDFDISKTISLIKTYFNANEKDLNVRLLQRQAPRH